MLKKTALFLLLIGVAVAFRMPEFIHFNYLTTKDGLSQNSINSIIQDLDGYIWIGTQDGLNCYDGYTFKVYRPDPNEPMSLKYTSITTLSVDKRGMLWIGSDAGLCRMHKQKDGSGTFQYVDDCPVVSLLTDSKNRLWIGTNHGLKILKADKIYPDTVSYVIPEKYTFTCIEETRDGRIWAGTVENGIFEIIPGAPHSKIRRILASSQTFKSNHIQAIHKDRFGFLWIATLEGGVSKYDPIRKEFINYIHNPRKTGSLSGNDVLSLLEDAEGRIWVGTANHGLCSYNPERDSFTRYPYHNNDAVSLNNSGVVSLMQDRSGTFWVGTNGGGLNYFNLDGFRFLYHQVAHTSRRNKYKNCIWAMAEEKENKIYVGTNQGVYCRSFTNHSRAFLIPQGLGLIGNTAVHALCFGRNGVLWIGTLKNGLFRYNEKKKDLKNYRSGVKGAGTFPSNIIYTIYEDRQGLLWIGSNGRGLIRFDPKTEYAEPIGMNITKQDSIGNWIVMIFADRDNDSLLWLGSWNDGLIRFNKFNRQFKTYRALRNSTILCIAQTDRDHLWLGTYGNGLLKFNVKDHGITAYTEKEGLSNNVVYAVLADETGCLWMSTNQGISRFNLRTETFINYDETNGLQDSEFNLGAALKTKDGRLFFGGVNGFNEFYPRNSRNRIPPSIMVRLTTGAGKTISVFDKQKVELPFYQNTLYFTLTAFHYKNSKKNKYAYKLEGFDDDWIYCGSQRTVLYKDLPGGSYIFRVKAANCDGVWSDEQAVYPIHIKSPFWENAWFYIFIVVVSLGIIVIVQRNHMKQKVKIEMEKRREREKIQRRLVADFHDELGHRVTKILFLSKILKDKKAHPDKNEYIDKIIGNADSLFKEIREFIWELDPAENTLYDLAVHLKNFSDQIFDQTEIAFELQGVSAEMGKKTLPLNWRKEIMYIFKEAMHNILKHAGGCKKVALSIQLNKDILTMTLTNDGKGFEGRPDQKGTGLKNMRKRAENINGLLSINSYKTKGTRIRFTGKLS